MHLLLIRHAIAEDRESFARTGKDDRLRPLTGEGRRRMKRIARGLKKLVPELDLLATSPLARAAQTAAILDDAYGGLDEVEITELAPDEPPERLLAWLRGQQRAAPAAAGATLGMVGHEPALSRFLALLVTGGERPLHPFKKGGAVLLELPSAIAPGTATLLWAVPPRPLAELGG